MIKKSKHYRWLIVVVGSVVLLTGGYHLLKQWRFNSDAPVANFPAPQDAFESRQQDMQHLAQFLDLEKSWSGNNQWLAGQYYSSLVEKAVEMTDAEFELAVAELVAMADNAHTKVREYNRTPRYNRLPVRGYWFADGYHIIRAYRGYEYLLGGKIIALDGVPMANVRQKLSSYISGVKGNIDKYSPYLIESPELMHAAGIAQAPDAMALSIVLSGENEQIVIFKEPFPSSMEHLSRGFLMLSPLTYAKSQPEWKSLHTYSQATPVYLQKPIEQFQMMTIPELKASYIQFWTNSDSGTVSIKEFCRDALNWYRTNPTPVLIVDQRFNIGGNGDLTKQCMLDFGQSLPDNGRLYVAIGGATFSAGMTSVTALKMSGGEKTILVGEPVGDHLQHWGEDNLLRLPNSEIEIKFSTGMHDLGAPCRSIRKCYWGALFSDLYVDTLDPDIAAPLTYSDFANQNDPVMKAIKSNELALNTDA